MIVYWYIYMNDFRFVYYFTITQIDLVAELYDLVIHIYFVIR